MTSILLAGCGRMGGALARGWLERGIAASDIVAIDPAPSDPPQGIILVPDQSRVPEGFSPDVVVLATKPQIMAEAVPPLGRYEWSVFLSIAAGRTLGGLDTLLGGGRAIVRAMPNTPAAIGRGITVAVPNREVSGDQHELCGHLLGAVGEVAWVHDEALMDAVTAVSGSGPAYVFLLAEAMAEAGVAAGLHPDLAARLASVTVAGSGELLGRSAVPASALREAVTSPGGTTFAALQVLMAKKHGLTHLMTEAIEAATKRSRELAG